MPAHIGTCLQRDDPEAPRLDPLRFKPFWMSLAGGVLHLGCGPPGCGTILSVSLPGPALPLYVGFVSWDTRVAYRGMSVSAPFPRGPPPAALTPPMRSLLALSLAALRRAVTVGNVCAIVACLSRRWGVASPLWPQCISFIAMHFSEVLRADGAAFLRLPERAIAHVYASGDLHAPELALFLGLESWAYGASLAWALPGAGNHTHPPLSCSALHESASCVDDALRYIRFPLMTSAELARVHASPLLRDAPALSQLLHEARAHVEDAAELSGSITQFASATDRDELKSASVCTADSIHSAETTPRSPLGSAHSEQCNAEVSQRQQPHVAVPSDLEPGSARPMHGQYAQQPAACNSPMSDASASARAPREKCEGDCAQSAPAPAATPHRLHRQCDLWRRWRTQWRCPPDVVELVHTHNSDQNGAMHFLGCSGGANGRFVNPHRVGKVEVTSSSPFNRDSDPSQLVSQGYHKMACALPSADGQAFWAVRFAAGQRLACQHYSMRANGTSDFPTAWQLQGRDDAEDAWVQLHAVTGGHSFVRPGQCLSWPVQQPLQPHFCSELRVLLTGATSEGSRGLHVCHMELYGYLQGCVQCR